MKNKGLVSVIMNCHNGEKFLAEAINSVLGQTYKKWELIFWDNCSTDQSADIFKSFDDKRLKYFYTRKKVSLYESRNAAIKKTNGEFIAFLDVDDLWLPNKLYLQVKKFKDKKIGLVYGKYLKINENIFLRRKQIITKKNLPEGYIVNNLLKNYNVGLLTIMLRSKFIKNKNEIFNIKYNYLGDLDFVLNFSLKYKFGAVQEIIGIYRQHVGQMQKKFYKIKLKQLKNWYNEICTKKVFGEKKNIKLFHEWIKFLSLLMQIKKRRNIKTFLKIIKYQNNFNKIKLLIVFFIPKYISEKLITET